ncbi:hypothetical protein ILYODFUR_038874 [Ilyodon furcidens]|uniref:Uncharacterized protein n=1 Tax=Ilyodon furcidens TaxID=33524 RepID=A0ABV0UDN5_9TELE
MTFHSEFRRPEDPVISRPSPADQTAGDVGADDLTAGSGTRRIHGGAQRHGVETNGTQASGAKTARTFGEAVEICGGAPAAQHEERVRPRTPQGQEKEVETCAP